ncbi:MAG TPA: hypothetical protein VIH63_11720, partial [Xanthobacteraceae bacterium]
MRQNFGRENTRERNRVTLEFITRREQDHAFQSGLLAMRNCARIVSAATQSAWQGKRFRQKFIGMPARGMIVDHGCNHK